MPNDGREDETNPKPIEIKLDPAQLLFAALDGFALEILGADPEELPHGLIVYRDFEPPLELRGLDYWLRFGERILLDLSGQLFLIEVPTVYEVLQSLHKEHKERQRKELERMRLFMNSVWPERPTAPGERVRLGELIDRFFDLSLAQQAKAITLLRRNFAAATLAHSFTQPVLDAYATVRSSLTPGTDLWKFWEFQRSGALTVQARYPVDRDRSERLFERWYNWENNVLPAPDGPQVIQFLPPPLRDQREGEGEDAVVDGNPAEINVCAEDVEAVPLDRAGQRFAIYRKFGCKRVVRPRRLFGKEEHNSFGYLFRTLQGTWLMAIDCDAFGRAAYLCQINPNDPFRYIIDVQLPRKELRRILAERGEGAPGPEDEAPTYIGREVHDATFAMRMRRRYEED